MAAAAAAARSLTLRGQVGWPHALPTTRPSAASLQRGSTQLVSRAGFLRWDSEEADEAQEEAPTEAREGAPAGGRLRDGGAIGWPGVCGSE